MDQRSDQILEHIEAQKDRLGENLNELESRVKETTDWRAQFEKHPMLMMGVAMGGGLLLGAVVGGVAGSRSSSSYSSGSGSEGWSSERGYAAASSTPSSVTRATSPALREQKQRALDTLDTIKGALIAFGAAKAKEYLKQMLPGFEHHLAETEQRFSQNPQSASGSYPKSGSSYESGSGSFNGPYEGSSSGSSYRPNEGARTPTPGY